MRSVLVVGLLLFIAAPSRVDAQWIEGKSAHYSVFYQNGYEKDVEFTRMWLNRAEQLMKDKDQTNAPPTTTTCRSTCFPLQPATSTRSRVGKSVLDTRECRGLSTGTINLLAPSASVWKEASLKSSLGLPKTGEDSHAKVMMSEDIPIGHYAVQDARTSGGWRY